MIKMPKAIKTGEKMTHSANGAGNPGCEDAESGGTGLTSALSKPNCRCTKDINIRPESWKLLEKQVGSTHHPRGTDKNFLRQTPVVQKIRQLTNGIS